MATGMGSHTQYGDPAVGPYQVLIRFPAGTTVQPHYHKADEFAVVTSGTVLVGEGHALDESKAVEVGPGGYFLIPAGTAHWAKCKAEAVIARLGNGPREMTPCSAEKPAPKAAGVKVVKAADVAWKDASDLAAGAKSCVTYGDPAAGLHVFRLAFPAGVVRSPHWHSSDECVTILSGRMMIGQGDRVDESKATALGPGGYFIVPAGVHHWLVAQEASVFSVTINGKRDVFYVK
jgi:quercetin dioxygenase-like cupin family protein